MRLSYIILVSEIHSSEYASAIHIGVLSSQVLSIVSNFFSIDDIVSMIDPNLPSRQIRSVQNVCVCLETTMQTATDWGNLWNSIDDKWELEQLNDELKKCWALLLLGSFMLNVGLLQGKSFLLCHPFWRSACGAMWRKWFHFVYKIYLTPLDDELHFKHKMLVARFQRLILCFQH